MLLMVIIDFDFVQDLTKLGDKFSKSKNVTILVKIKIIFVVNN